MKLIINHSGGSYCPLVRNKEYHIIINENGYYLITDVCISD